MALKFFKVTTLPGSLEADSFYYVNNGSYAESYITNNAGVAKAIGNTAMIEAIATQVVEDALAEAASNPVEIAADISARDAIIAAATTNKLILVTDATADTSVASGAALYVWNETAATTTKIAEYESMDVTLTWAAITGKPSSAPSLIDDAVTKRHTHANISTLDKLGESSGSLTFDGNAVSTQWNTTNW